MYIDVLLQLEEAYVTCNLLPKKAADYQMFMNSVHLRHGSPECFTCSIFRSGMQKSSAAVVAVEFA
jgi:hypothetical protein